MSPLGMPVILWLWAGGAFVVAVLWARDCWRGWRGRTSDAAARGITTGGSAQARAASSISSASADRWRPSPAQRKGGDAVEVLRRTYGRAHP